MDALETAERMVCAIDDVSVGIPPLALSLVGLGKGVNAVVGDAAALDEAYPLELRQVGQPNDGLVCQVHAASQVDVADAVARQSQALDGGVGDLAAMAQVHIVQIFAQAGDGVYGVIGDQAALGKHEVSQAGGHLDDLLDGPVCELETRREVEDAQVLVGLRGREGEEGVVIDELAVGEAQLAERLALGEKVRNGLVADEAALVEIDLEDVGAVPGDGLDGFVVQLDAVVQLELHGNLGRHGAGDREGGGMEGGGDPGEREPGEQNIRA